MSRREKTWWWIAAVVILLYCLFPIAWILSLSFKAPSDIANASFLPTTFSGVNYKEIFTGSASDLFLPALRNSFGICLIATFISCILAMFAAYAIARLDFPGKKLILSTALVVAIFPVISIVTPLFNLWRQIGLYDTWLGLIIPYMTFSLPLAIYTLSAFFREIPWDLEKAAKVDGATPFQAFVRVIAPLAAPGMVTTAILVFLFCWNEFLLAISLTSTIAARTAPAALAFFNGSSQFTVPTGSISAAAVVITIPIIIFVLFFQRRIVAGLTSGAVKG